MDIFFSGSDYLCGATPEAGEPLESYRDFDGEPVCLYDIPADSLARFTGKRLSLRQLAGELPPGEYAKIARGRQVLHWRRQYRFCPSCGAPLLRKHGPEMAMHCDNCQVDFFPRIDTAVIVAIEHEGRILLAERLGQDGTPFFSLVAGFVEAGESLEEAVRREVKEEVGLELESLDYVRSQPWPFPSQLMVGFKAKAKNGDIRPDGVEIKKAGWFGRGNLPDSLPAPFSIARKLIEAWREGWPG